MTPQRPSTPTPRFTRATLLLAFGAALLFALPSGAAQPAPAVITVDFSEDDMGFNVTSTKDISNVIVVLCDESQHKHDDLDGLYFNHTEEQKVTGVYVKSGNNGIEGNDPPGAGEFFANEGVSCSSTSTSTSETTTSTSETTTTTSDTETTTSETTSTTSDTETTTEVPFFGAPAVMGLGIAGAVGGALFMLRRRL